MLLSGTLLLFVAMCVALSMGSPVHPKNKPPYNQIPRRFFGDDAHFASSGGASKRYYVPGDKWGRTQLTYGLVNTGNDLSADKVKSIFKNAFKIWSDQTFLRFTYVDDVSKADIKIRFASKSHPPCPYSFDGPGNSLAHAFYPTVGKIHLDDDETFTDGTYSGTNLLAVAVHEIGHVIGIGHSKWTKAVMYDEYKGYDPNLKLHADDINAASHLYGGPTVVTPATTIPPCVDHYSNCAQYADQCDTAAMRENCPYTCYVCRPNLECKDKYSTSLCEKYKTLGYCGSPMIIDSCRKTCTNCSKNLEPTTVTPTTVTPTTRATSNPPCVDHYSNCPQYADKCENPYNIAAMQKNCPYTCYVCRFKCEDDYPQSNCEYYKTHGLCSTSFVAANCRKTCQTPGSNCPVD